MQNDSFEPVEFNEGNYSWSDIYHDVSGNDDYVENDSGDSNESLENEPEQVTYNSFDYTSDLANIQNNQLVTNALLIACILLIGVIAGLKKL